MNTCILIRWAPTLLGSSIIFTIALILISHILAAGGKVVGGKNLVSRGTNTSGINQCYGGYNSTTQTGWGPAYQYNCIHSGLIKTSGDIATTYYNYALASAGTITDDENTTSSNPAANINPATESICPKGWTLPSKTQIDSQRNVASFSPVLGGYYDDGILYYEDTYGLWWGSTAYNGASRYYLGYDGSSLFTLNRSRRRGYYIRCINKQKTVLDLTYMQEMTPEIASMDFVMWNLLPVLSEYFDEPKKIFKILENCHVRTVKTAVRHV